MSSRYGRYTRLRALTSPWGKTMSQKGKFEKLLIGSRGYKEMSLEARAVFVLVEFLSYEPPDHLAEEALSLVNEYRKKPDREFSVMRIKEPKRLSILERLRAL